MGNFIDWLKYNFFTVCNTCGTRLHVRVSYTMGACGQVDRALDLRSESLGFDS